MRVVKYRGNTSELWNAMLILQPVFATCLAREATEKEAYKKALATCKDQNAQAENCLLYTSPSPRDATLSRMPSSA